MTANSGYAISDLYKKLEVKAAYEVAQGALAVARAERTGAEKEKEKECEVAQQKVEECAAAYPDDTNSDRCNVLKRNKATARVAGGVELTQGVGARGVLALARERRGTPKERGEGHPTTASDASITLRGFFTSREKSDSQKERGPPPPFTEPIIANSNSSTRP